MKTYVCSECSSNDVLFDAYVKWDENMQDFVIDNIFDKGHFCNNCEGECKIDQVETAKN